MKVWSFLAPAYLLAVMFKIFYSDPLSRCRAEFCLTYSTVGFGSNHWSQQPFFRIKKGYFVYTLEDAWIHPHEPARKTDTLASGSMRQSSIDSIQTIIRAIPDTMIYKSSQSLSGTQVSIQVSLDTRKMSFLLWNESDSSAEKVVTILNSYVPTSIPPLVINGLASLDH